MNKHSLIKHLGNQRGIVAIFAGILIVAMLGFFALAIELAWGLVTRNELQNISDGSALAAARWIGAKYDGSLTGTPMTYEEQMAYDSTADRATIVGRANAVATENMAGGMHPISISDVDVVIGHWDPATRILTADPMHPNAVSVTARRDNAMNGPLLTTFARLIGIDSMNVSSNAVAALTSLNNVGPGGLPFPVGISHYWFDYYKATGYCNQAIRFYPTNDIVGCAGWNIFISNKNANAKDLRTLVIGLTNGTITSPETHAYKDEFAFIGGTVASAFPELITLFDTMRVKNDGLLDADDNDLTWTTTVPVYDSDDCSNPSGNITIVGFATVKITKVTDSPAKTIEGIVECGNIREGRGGGDDTGTLGSIPGLVK